jgi:hypothetical protein
MRESVFQRLLSSRFYKHQVRLARKRRHTKQEGLGRLKNKEARSWLMKMVLTKRTIWIDGAKGSTIGDIVGMEAQFRT